jgi:phosphoribosylaminoimidazolecarboxamide formyltransferase/IMP cyclohydrolase
VHPQSAFGGVVAFNTVVDRATAEALTGLFLEVVVAPSFHEEALEVLAGKKNLRAVELPVVRGLTGLDMKRVRGGLLVQDRFVPDLSDAEWKVATRRAPTAVELRDPRAWAAVAAVKSMRCCSRAETIGIGAGQMSRVDSSFVAVTRRTSGPRPEGSMAPMPSSPSPTAWMRRPRRESRLSSSLAGRCVTPR